MEGVQYLICKYPHEENLIPLPEISTKKPGNREVDGSDENM